MPRFARSLSLHCDDLAPQALAECKTVQRDFLIGFLSVATFLVIFVGIIPSWWRARQRRLLMEVQDTLPYRYGREVRPQSLRYSHNPRYGSRPPSHAMNPNVRLTQAPFTTRSSTVTVMPPRPAYMPFSSKITTKDANPPPPYSPSVKFDITAKSESA
ncbi:hypothetical protein M422DRAFT_64728 [Sphaerobolus stellatus SS14]|nr:hypothetical protein M422DRAFT_64728 [Sphaerobolus stellatus SS14]